ncbi:MAG: biotin--[acetyl-CoA-carboxylase] ligase [Oscillospiraceae bacterium]|nr:biotin--[acetyl-CoA-carboxylase] ligase [Oscillospiraceae bacterium]
MGLKTRVLEILENNRGRSISGNSIANSLGITRSAVWKAVVDLRREGYIIDAVTNRGYCLTGESGLMNERSIQGFLTTEHLGRKLDVFKTIDSTNNFAKSLAQLGGAHGHTIIAEQQTVGRGRADKSFYSPANQGIYMSVIVRPRIPVACSPRITACTAVAVADAIKDTAGIECGIKWVNDIFVHGKKLCGILTEAAVGVETGELDYAVIGIGINANNAEFPDEIKDTATSLFFESRRIINRAELTANVLNRLESRLKELESGSFMNEYRERSILIGKRARILSGDRVTEYDCTGIDDNGFLVVRDMDGNEEHLSTGTILS